MSNLIVPSCYSTSKRYIVTVLGLSVTDLEKAVDFYTKVLGWYVIMPPTEIMSDDSAIGVMCDAVFGKGWGSFKIAHLSTGDKIGGKILRTPQI